MTVRIKLIAHPPRPVKFYPGRKRKADTPSFLLQGQVLYRRLNLQMERQDCDVIMNWGVKEPEAGLWGMGHDDLRDRSVDERE